jgi:hypothetical protein
MNTIKLVSAQERASSNQLFYHGNQHRIDSMGKSCSKQVLVKYVEMHFIWANNNSVMPVSCWLVGMSEEDTIVVSFTCHGDSSNDEPVAANDLEQ